MNSTVHHIRPWVHFTAMLGSPPLKRARSEEAAPAWNGRLGFVSANRSRGWLTDRVIGSARAPSAGL